MGAMSDEALDIVPRTGSEVVGGHVHHGPMVAEPLGIEGPPDTVIPREEEIRLPSQGQAIVSGPPGSLARARAGAGWRQQLQQWSGTRREAHRRTTLAALHRCWAPQRETCRPLCAEAALEMAAAQAGLSVAARLYGLC